MNREAAGSLLLFVGLMVLQVGVTDLHLRYVKPEMQPLLLVAGMVLAGLGARGLLVLRREAAHAGEAPAGDEHGHHHQPRTAWLLVLPLVVLALVAPPSLGAFAASRSGPTVIDEPSQALPPLAAPTDGAVTLGLGEYYTRAMYDAESLSGATVRLTGFVVPLRDRWTITRMKLSCCAADGRPLKVVAAGDAARQAPPTDAWVEVIGTLSPPQEVRGVDGPQIAIEVDRVRPVPEPTQTYE